MANNIDEEETLKKLEELKKEAKEGAKNRNRVNLLYNMMIGLLQFCLITTILRKDHS